VNPEMLARLVCPATRTRLRYDESAQELVSDEAGLAYPVRNEVPVLIPDEARRIAS
jgi:uncharacterized protein YbaR (Trm112 family)